MRTIHDPANYAAMSVPHASPEVQKEALNAFLEGVSRLRKKFRVKDVLIVVASDFVDENREVKTNASYSHLGDMRMVGPLATHVLLREREAAVAQLATANKSILEAAAPLEHETAPLKTTEENTEAETEKAPRLETES